MTDSPGHKPMMIPFAYEHVRTSEFGGTKPTDCTFDDARVVVLPIPLDRTTSYVPGTRNGPREIILASSHLEHWDEETGSEPYQAGIFTLPEMEFPFDSMGEVMAEIGRIASDVMSRGKFPVVLGGEHSITGPVVAAAAAAHPGLSVLQIDAHADLRDSFMGSPHNHACVMRRVLERVPAVQVGIRSLSAEEAAVAPSLPTTIFYDFDMRRDADWVDRVIASLTDTVYITIDSDAFDPAIMPATGTPEPGGLRWYEALTLLRRVFEKKNVVGFDLVELSPIPGNISPNFLCAKLVYKLIGYRFTRASPE